MISQTSPISICDPDAYLGKMLTDLLQNERRRSKFLEGSEGMFPREIFSILPT